jgi:hypothetical protein
MQKIRTILLVAIVLLTMGALELPLPCQRSGEVVSSTVCDQCPPTCTCHLASPGGHACGTTCTSDSCGASCAADGGAGTDFPDLALPPAHLPGLLSLATELALTPPATAPTSTGRLSPLYEPTPPPRPPQA